MGILRTARNVAIASAVHGRVQRRQHDRWAAMQQPVQHAPAAPAPEVPAAAAPAAPAAPAGTQDMLDQLRQLGELRTAGVLTDAEFEAQKARILGS